MDASDDTTNNVTETLRDLFSRIEAGDRRAFNRFFERQSSRMLIYINYNIGQRLRRKLDPDDILQNVYLRIVKDFAAFVARAEKRGVQKALIRMADHEITEAYRFHFKVEKRDARREITQAFIRGEGGHLRSLVEWVPSDSTSVSARIVREEEYQRAMAMLGKLSPLEQYVTVARIIEGSPTREIAERVGKSRGAVQMIIARVREKLRERFSYEEDDAETGTEDHDSRTARE